MGAGQLSQARQVTLKLRTKPKGLDFFYKLQEKKIWSRFLEAVKMLFKRCLKSSLLCLSEFLKLLGQLSALFWWKVVPNTGMEFAYADVRLGHELEKETSVYQACTEPQGQDADELGDPRDHPGSPFCASVALRTSGLTSTELVRQEPGIQSRSA